MADVVNMAFVPKYRVPSTPPTQPMYHHCHIVSLPKNRALGLMTNQGGISFLSITVNVYNKILLNRIRDHADPSLRATRLDFVLEEVVLSRSTSLDPDYRRISRLSASLLQLHSGLCNFISQVSRGGGEGLGFWLRRLKAPPHAPERAVLQYFGIPETLFNTIMAIEALSALTCKEMVDRDISDLLSGILQGDHLASFLYLLY